jgi:hypothetical protein
MLRAAMGAEIQLFVDTSALEALITNGFARIETLLLGLGIQMGTAAAALSALQAQVATNTTVEGSAVVLIQGIAAQLAAMAAQGTVDPAALTALAAALGASATPLAAAVTANTPAAAKAS